MQLWPFRCGIVGARTVWWNAALHQKLDASHVVPENTGVGGVMLEGMRRRRFLDMCIDMFIDTYIDMFVDMCIGMLINMRTDMCIDM